MNENLLAIAIVLMAVILTVLGLDDGDLIKSVVSAYLGFLAARRYDSIKANRPYSGIERRKALRLPPLPRKGK